MNITRACISVSLAFMTSTAAVPLASAAGGLGGRIGGSPWGSPGALSRAALDLELATQIDGASRSVPEAEKARRTLDAYVQKLDSVRRTVRSTPSEVAKQRLTEAESQFALARLQAYTGTWADCSEAAGQALAHLESAGDIAEAWRAERRGFDPGASATLLHAEHARNQATVIAEQGRIQSARWKAESALDLAVIAMEQASGHAMAPPGNKPTWIARTSPRVAAGAGGDVR